MWNSTGGAIFRMTLEAWFVGLTFCGLVVLPGFRGLKVGPPPAGGDFSVGMALDIYANAVAPAVFTVFSFGLAHS